MFLKRHSIRKDGKQHVYYSLVESIRLSRHRTVQRRLLNLGELNNSQVERWQRSIEVLEESGQRRQLRLFTDESPSPTNSALESAEVVLSSLQVRRPRSFGAPWLGCRLWEALEMTSFWEAKLRDHAGPYSWAKVLELLVVNRLCQPGSELSVHERWFDSTAMDFLLDCDQGVAGKDRLYRALDKALPHKEALMSHLQRRWENLFHADCQVLLYDLTSTYFEGQAEGVSKAKRGYSRDHRPDCLQIILALVVSAEGFPLCYEVFDGNRADVTTMESIVEVMEKKYGFKGRVWVFDRGVVSEENLANLRQRGASYVVGTPRHRLREFERELLQGQWQEVSGRSGVKVQLIQRAGEVFVLARSVERAHKEGAMRKGQLIRLDRSLRRLALLVARGRLKTQAQVERRLGRLEERYSGAWRYLKKAQLQKPGGQLRLVWQWNKERLRHLRLKDGSYLLRTNLDPMEPEAFWNQYVQLTEVESAFRCLKSELSIRPIWHRLEKRVEGHILVAFLGYCLLVCLKQMLKATAESITPTRALESLQNILMVEVWFDLRDGRQICLPRITQPEKEQLLLLHHLGWSLPDQPPPRIYAGQVNTSCGDNLSPS